MGLRVRIVHPISLHGMKKSCVCGRRVSWISCSSVIARNDMYWRSPTRCGAVGGIVGFTHTIVDLTDGKVRRNFLLRRLFLPPFLDPGTVHPPSDGSARRFLFGPSNRRTHVCMCVYHAILAVVLIWISPFVRCGPSVDPSHSTGSCLHDTRRLSPEITG